MIKGLELFQIVQFYYTIAATLYAIPKYLYLYKKKTLVIFPVLLLCSSITAGIIIVTDFMEFYIYNYYYEEITGGVLGWLIASSICFAIYNFCYWIMSTLYIDVKEDSVTVHSLFFSKMKIKKSDILLSESFYCFIPREFKVNEILLITLRDGRRYKLGFDAVTHHGDTEKLCNWIKKMKRLNDKKKYKDLMKSNKYQSLTFKFLP